MHVKITCEMFFMSCIVSKSSFHILYMWFLSSCVFSVRVHLILCLTHNFSFCTSTSPKRKSFTWIGENRVDGTLLTFVLFLSLLFLLVGLPFAILTIQHKSFKRGFFCNDDSIKYPYKEDTISYQLLGGVMIPVTLLTVSAHLFVVLAAYPISVSFSLLSLCL